MSALRVAIVGAGPVGLEMALAALDRGLDAHVFEAGRVGEHLSWFRDVALFTPLSMNSTEGTRERLGRAGVTLPSGDSLLTAGEFVERCLAPVAGLAELRGRVHERCRVAAIARAGAVKSGASGAARGETPFVLRLEEEGGAARFAEADIVVDASGVVGRPRSFGPGGLEARGEGSLGDRVDRHLPSRADLRARYAGRRALLIGNGHSAATALVELDALARAGAGPTRVHWVCRTAEFHERPGDPLPARRELASRANLVASGASWLERHPGATVEGVDAAIDGSMEVTLCADASGASTRARVDRVLSLVGYRPDNDLSRELPVHTCYASEGPMALAAALANARAANGGDPGDCLAQTTHGPETLRTTEPGFFVIGAKSYGRHPDFLLRLGYEQVRDVISLLAASPSRRLEAPV